MKRTIIALIFAVLASTVSMPAKAESITTKSISSILSSASDKSAGLNDRQKKRKLKKKVRQAGRVYKLVKSDRKDKKKARKTQRKIRRVINIW